MEWSRVNLLSSRVDFSFRKESLIDRFVANFCDVGQKKPIKNPPKCIEDVR